MPTPDQPVLDELVQTYRPQASRNGHQEGVHVGAKSIFTDEQVIDLCRNAKRQDRDKFSRLFDQGDTSGHKSNASSADFALIAMFGFFTQDPEQLERLMRKSPLVRPKWDTNRAGKTWIRYSIDNALKDLKDTYTPPQGEQRHKATDRERATDKGSGGNRLVQNRVQLAGMLEGDIEPVPFLQPSVLVRGSVHLFFGPPECGKSWLALWAAVQAIKRGEVVLYLDSENGKRLVSERLRLLGATEEEVRAYLHYLPQPDLDLSEGAVRDFAEFLDEVEPELVIFDSWVNFLAQAGLSEDSSTDIEAWAQTYAFPTKHRGITTVILDHTPHEMDRPRGSSRKTAVVDFSRSVRKRKDFDRETVGEVQLYGGKDRESVFPREVRFAVGPHEDGGTIFRPFSRVVEERSPEDGLKPSERRVLGILKDAGKGLTHAGWLKAYEGDRLAHGESGDFQSTFKRGKRRLLDLELVNGFMPKSRGQKSVTPTGLNQYPRDTQFWPLHKPSGSEVNQRPEPDFSAKESEKPHSGSDGVRSGSEAADTEGVESGSGGRPPYRGRPPEPDSPVSTEKYTYVQDAGGLKEAISCVSNADLVGLDMETTSINPHVGELRLVQVSDSESTFVVDAFKVDPKPLLETVFDKEWVAHNAAFELTWAKYLFDLEPTSVRDTMIMSQVLEAGSEYKHGLEDVLKRELGIELDKEQQTSDWSAANLTEEQLDYAATDAWVLPELYRRLEQRLGEER